MSNVLDKFLRYVKINTQSNPEGTETPTSPGQWDLARLLVSELEAMGAADVALSSHCIVTASIPATSGCENKPAIGFIAHMDTSDSAPGEHVNPQIVRNYDGGVIPLGAGRASGARSGGAGATAGNVLDAVSEAEAVSGEAPGTDMGFGANAGAVAGSAALEPWVFPTLQDHVGKTLVVTDGRTLLGADDKAGIAEIMTMAQYLLQNPQFPHGPVRIAFTPDEEGADGIRHFDVQGFGAAFAYTVDGGELGEIEYENFNAASFTVTVHGREVHPGSAKGKMVNALMLGIEFASLLPESETPATTEGYEGYYHLCDMSGNCTEATLSYILREHDKELFEKRKSFIKNTCDYLNQKYGEERFTIEMKDSYYNMKEKILPHMYLIENAKKAMEQCGVTPIISPIRGGTDGARLSFNGLPCPNLSTGGYNFHGRYEYIPVESMEKMVEVLTALACM